MIGIHNILKGVMQVKFLVSIFCFTILLFSNIPTSNAFVATDKPLPYIELWSVEATQNRDVLLIGFTGNNTISKLQDGTVVYKDIGDNFVIEQNGNNYILKFSDTELKDKNFEFVMDKPVVKTLEDLNQKQKIVLSYNDIKIVVERTLGAVVVSPDIAMY